jgi:hypothetical protein
MTPKTVGSSGRCRPRQGWSQLPLPSSWMANSRRCPVVRGHGVIQGSDEPRGGAVRAGLSDRAGEPAKRRYRWSSLSPGIPQRPGTPRGPKANSTRWVTAQCSARRNGCRKEPRDDNSTSRSGIAIAGPAVAKLRLGTVAESRAPSLSHQDNSVHRTGAVPTVVRQSLLWNRARGHEMWL